MRSLPLLLLCAPAAAYVVVGGTNVGVGGRRATVVASEPTRFEVCQNKYCRKKGSKATLALFEELAEGREDVLVSAADMSHTEHGCFDECLMGPNVRVGGDGPKTDNPPGKIMNYVKGEEAVRELLGSPP